MLSFNVALWGAWFFVLLALIFYYKPFLLEGVFYGIGGALLAAVFLGALYSAASGNPSPLLRAILPLSPSQILAPCFAMMIFAGALFGVLGALFSFSHSQKTAGG